MIKRTLKTPSTCPCYIAALSAALRVAGRPKLADQRSLGRGRSYIPKSRRVAVPQKDPFATCIHTYKTCTVCVSYSCMSQLHSALCKGEVGVDPTHKSVNIILNYIYKIWLLRSLGTAVCANPRGAAVCMTLTPAACLARICNVFQVTSIPFLPHSDAGYELQQVVYTLEYTKTKAVFDF